MALEIAPFYRPANSVMVKHRDGKQAATQKGSLFGFTGDCWWWKTKMCGNKWVEHVCSPPPLCLCQDIPPHDKGKLGGHLASICLSRTCIQTFQCDSEQRHLDLYYVFIILSSSWEIIKSFGHGTASSRIRCLLSGLPHVGVFYCLKDQSGPANPGMSPQSANKSACISGNSASPFLGIRICTGFKSHILPGGWNNGPPE